MSSTWPHMVVPDKRLPGEDGKPSQGVVSHEIPKCRQYLYFHHDIRDAGLSEREAVGRRRLAILLQGGFPRCPSTAMTF